MPTTVQAVCRLCRREGAKLFLKGERCYSRKCSFDKRSYPPGQHGQTGRVKIKEYGVQLREKQKMRRIYGVRERQFRSYFKEAVRLRGVTGEDLVRQLEVRLDNVVYRLGMSVSRAQARELVGHGHFTVNGRKVNTPSYQVRPGDVIEARESSRGLAPIVYAIEHSGTSVPSWLKFDAEKRRGEVDHIPLREEIDTQVEETLIVEFYSR